MLVKNIVLSESIQFFVIDIANFCKFFYYVLLILTHSGAQFAEGGVVITQLSIYIAQQQKTVLWQTHSNPSSAAAV